MDVKLRCIENATSYTISLGKSILKQPEVHNKKIAEKKSLKGG